MNRIVIAIAVILALVVAAAAAWWVLDRTNERPERSAPETHPLPPFRQIAVEGAAEVTLVQGASEAVAIDVPGRSIVRAEVRDGMLAIRAVDDRHWWSYLFAGAGRRPPHVTVTFRELDALRASGTVKLVAERLRADSLTLRFSGAATVTIPVLEARALAIAGSGAFKADIGGRVDEQKISISGAGDYRAGDLVSDRASISVSGAGRVLVNAQKALDVDLSGAGKVDYKGDPKITQRVSGAGRIRRFDSAERLPPLASDGLPVNAASVRPRAVFPA